MWFKELFMVSLKSLLEQKDHTPKSHENSFPPPFSPCPNNTQITRHPPKEHKWRACWQIHHHQSQRNQWKALCQFVGDYPARSACSDDLFFWVAWVQGWLHPGRLTWTIMMEVWKIIFLFLNGWFVGSMLIFQGVDWMGSIDSWTNFGYNS